MVYQKSTKDTKNTKYDIALSILLFFSYLILTLHIEAFKSAKLLLTKFNWIFFINDLFLNLSRVLIVNKSIRVYYYSIVIKNKK